MTCWTCSGVTFLSSNLIVQTVPPVKSMAYCRPTFPPVTGPSRRKIRPGIVIRREKAKNQFRLPMTSNTPAGLAPHAAAAGRRAGQELGLGHVEERRLPRPRLLDDDAERRPRDHDRGEHRDEHADDQHEAEAPDRRGAEKEQD